jgi:hypothetical protein
VPGTFTFDSRYHPICEIGLSTVREYDPGSWYDCSCYVHEAEIFRGRERFTDRFQPGVASITLDNRNGWADFGDTYAEVATSILRPGRQIRVGVRGPFNADGTVVTRWLFYGWIDQTTPAYDPVLHDVVTINCIDALGEVGQMVAPAMPTQQGVNETVPERLDRILDAVNWWDEKRNIGSSSTRVQGTVLGTQVIDLLGVTADSAGGVIFGSMTGDIVFKDLNWELWDPDVPADGEIGNCDPGEPPDPGTDTPPYTDPTLGPVYDPCPPIPKHPECVDICVAPFEGTVVEQGDAWRIYIHDGHLWYESSGHLWDMGEWDGTHECARICHPPPPPPPPPNGPPPPPPPPTICFDPPCDPTGTGTEVPFPFMVELIGYDDGGLADGPQSTVTVSTLQPGNDCMLVVLINAICAGSSTLRPWPISSGSITAGSLVFEQIDVESVAGLEGIETYGAGVEIGRTDPGTIDLTVDWAGDEQSKQHIVTVWRVRKYRPDLFARMKIGAYLHNATSDRGHGGVVITPNPPGKGAWELPYETADTAGTEIVPFSRPTDIAIGVSLADESTGPFGATFDETDGEWIEWPQAGTGATTNQSGLFCYIFPFTSGHGPSTSRGDYGGSIFAEIRIAHPDGSYTTVVDGEWVGDAEIDNIWINDLPVTYRFESDADGTARILANGHLICEGVVPDAANPADGSHVGWGNQWTRTHYTDTGDEPNTGAWWTTAVRYSVDGVTTLSDDFERETATGESLGPDWLPGGDAYGYTHADAIIVSGRAEDPDGRVVFPGGTQWPVSSMLSAAEGPADLGPAGYDQWIEFDTDNQFQALSAGGNGGLVVEGDWYVWLRAPAAAIPRKASWVAGTRAGVGAPDVKWLEVNTGADDIQSAQAILVMESGADVGFAWRILDYHIGAPITGGALPAGSFTSTIRPERTATILVFVAAFDDAEVMANITVSCPTLTFTQLLTHPTDTLGWGQGALWSAKLDGFLVDPLAPPVVTVAWSSIVAKLVYAIYEVSNAFEIEGFGAAVRGTHAPGSLGTGGVVVSMSATPATESVTLGFLCVAETADNTHGAIEGPTPWLEEIQVPADGRRAYFQVQSRGGVTATDGLVPWQSMDQTTGTQTSTDAVAIAVAVRPMAGYTVWSSYDPLMIGGSRNAFGGPIYSVTGHTDGTTDWDFDPATFGPH